MVDSTKLDPDQRNFLQRMRQGQLKNAWIRGFAGSGKSVLLVHALIEQLDLNKGKSACVVLYTHSLIELFRSGIPDALGQVPVVTYHQFVKNPSSYDIILVDEVQDLPSDVLTMLKAFSNHLFVAGDEAQSIYNGRATSEEITSIVDGENYPLTILHRLTSRVIEIAQALFPGKQLDRAKHQRLVVVDPVIARSGSEDDEEAYVWQMASQNAQPGYPVAILVPSHALVRRFANAALRIEGSEPWEYCENRYEKPDYDSMNGHLSSAGIRLQYVGNRYGSLEEAEHEGRVVLMTYHSSKGLDFQSVFLPYLNDDLVIWRDQEERSKTLFYVAMTRSRRDLTFSYTGEPHRFVKMIPDRLGHRIELPLPEPGSPTPEDDDVTILF